MASSPTACRRASCGRRAAVAERRDRLVLLDGGAPAFAEMLHVGRPNLGDRARLMQRISDLLDRRWLTNDGPYVRELEAAIAARAGVPHCVAVCNGTVALDLALRALGLDGEVIVPSFTFVASAHAITWAGLKARFADVDERTHNLDPARVAEAIGPRTSAILGVHLWGRPCAVDALEELASARKLKLVFDSAHALGASYRGRPVGSFGDCEIFSFHATKFVNSFEGGAIVTRDEALAKKLRLMRNFGFAGYDDVVALGTNGKLCEPAAAMGLTSLESFDAFVAANRRNHDAYARALDGVPGVRLLGYDERERGNWQYVVLEVDGALSRDLLMRALHAENVFARRYFYPGVHRMAPYRDTHPDAAASLPVTERLTARVLCLPNGTSVGVADVDKVAAVIRAAVARAAEIVATSRTATAPTSA
ncbi:MAG: dTDP-4-dehydro-6-deoxyglucose aminotransferase [bacterium]|nr:dTDP-4-dehydro-6-deoxyglucose aminotransferase [bacterium]